MTPEAGTAAALAFDLCTWIDRLFPDRDRGERLKRALRERFGDDARAVTDELCREVEAVAHELSRHFALEYVADGSLVRDSEPPGWPPQDPRAVRLRAASVAGVARHPDGVGVLALDSLDGVHVAAPYLEAAFGLLRGARRGARPAPQRWWRSRDGDPRDRLAARRRTYQDLRRHQPRPHAAVVDDGPARGPLAASRHAGQHRRRRGLRLVRPR